MRRLIAAIALLSLAACGQQAAVQPTASQAARLASPTAGPTAAAPPSAPGDPLGATPTALPTATEGPTNTPFPSRTPAPTPTAVPAPTVAPEIIAAPAPLDTPNLSENNAPPTPKPEPRPNPKTNPDQPVRLVVKAIGVDAEPISVGLDSANIPVVPKHDVGWYNLSARPGQGENVVFWGHVLRWKDSPKIPAPFARLKEAGPGTPITVYTADGAAHEYVVTEQVWVTPDQVQYILPVGSERITLVSCIGDKVVRDGSVELTHRLITIAEPAR